MLQILPALPSNCPAGSVKGFRGRSGFELDLSWKDDKLVEVTVRRLAGQTAVLSYGGKSREIEPAAATARRSPIGNPKLKIALERYRPRGCIRP